MPRRNSAHMATPAVRPLVRRFAVGRLAARVALALGALCASPAVRAAELDLKQLKLPPGFSIEVFAQVPSAREMALGDDGVIYVGSRAREKSGVYAVKNGKTFK